MKDLIQELIHPLPLGIQSALQITPFFIRESLIHVPMTIISYTDGALQKREQRDVSSLHSMCVKTDAEHLPFQEEVFECIISLFQLGFIDDIPSFLRAIHSLLKERGFFKVLFFGMQSLHELRHCFYEVDERLWGGIPNRFIPFIRGQDALNLMRLCGFKEPIVIIHRVKIFYAHVIEMMRDIKCYGFSSVSQKAPPLTKGFLQDLHNTYTRHFERGDGLPMSLEILVVSGWR